MKNLAKQRPAELVSGLAIAGAVYGFLSEYGVSNGIAAGVAAVCGFGPLVVSRFVDAVRSRR